MKILITGGCGFVGSNLSIFLKKRGFKVYSLDNLSRKGSKLNNLRLKKYKIVNYKISIQDRIKISKLKKFDIIIDCCAEPSVAASLKSAKDSRKVFETNLVGTFNILQKCIKDKSKIIFLSSSRVYSLQNLNKIKNKKKILSPLKKIKEINLNFDQNPPLSLYGFTKISSENLIKEMSFSNNIKYIINRCGVISGPWQMGKVDQGFVSLFTWSYLMNKKISFIGYGGEGHQIRDILHCDDLNLLILKQINKINKVYNKTYTVGGGKNNAISLFELSNILKFKTKKEIKIEKKKNTFIYDVPYVVMSNNNVSKIYNWKPKKNINDIINDLIRWIKTNKKILRNIFE
ncbi:NAD-dependent epimerase/dehydratase family protein [Candidatus Pelagibacter sp.]|nr:NAD-dependent epimerase/dehydratase family protein [Candidatus Pelagibacter sp.]